MSSETWEFPNWEKAHAAFAALGVEFAEAEKQESISEAIGKQLYAEAYLAATGSVEERKQKAVLDAAYRKWAMVDHPAVMARKSTARERIKAGEIWFRMVQTTAANIRAEKQFI
jgi:hypothetical protein